MKPRFSFYFRETRFLFLETQDLSSISLNMFFFRKPIVFDFFENPPVFDFSKTHQSSLNLNEGFFLKSPRPSLPLRALKKSLLGLW